MTNKKDKILYVKYDLHKRLKFYCLKHEITSMKNFVEPFLEAAINKPNAEERLERQAEELTEEERELIDKEMEILKDN